MATANYELKKGVLLQEFGFPEKACTNQTLTDELAEWHLKRHPEKSVLFARIPESFIPGPILPPPPPPQRSPQGGVKQIVAPEVIIIPPSKIAQEDPVKRKLLVDQALALGFESRPESRIELISSEELRTIILNLEKAKEKEPVESEVTEPVVESPVVEPEIKKQTAKKKPSKTRK